ncbi:hypothetical protein DMN91_001149 [Ooceraea biroi]|uniref:CG-1 domain-containing protein n=1 Tax=Ooceraea biroi TaxID=2015173 RepID=A0A3L8E6L7_OOCBI|nr:hypothetical protein DMN91_001149 [Ooceraea biroi]
MRQVVVLEPAGSVLVIRQTSLAGGGVGGNVNSNPTGTNDTHLVNHAAVSTIASNDHNQNRIVVVRSSTSSTCMTSSNERNDHLRNEHKNQDGIVSNETNPAAGCRPRTSKEVAHENVASDRKLDSADPISDGDPIKLPENLETLPRAEHFPTQRHRWNTNEEIAAILISFQRHVEWQSREVKVRPRSGSMLLYSRKKVRYRRDGYCWKKRKDGKTTREDHMKLKVQGVECIYGCYVHSAILPTFHRRCYWLLQNPDVVLVHYLNVPYPDGDAKLAALPPCLALPPDKKEWTRDELASQLRPMFLGGDDDPNNPHLTQHSNHPVDMIVSQLLDRQRASTTSSTSGTQLAPRRLTPDNQEIDAQENMDRSAVQPLPIGSSGSEVTDFAETLDLSQEDIQRTLSANMVPPSPSPSPADNNMINPMDFIDSSDDVLVNLDAFDVFGDLPELHDFEADQTKHEEQRGPENDVGCHPGTTVHIAEYSPEWSYTEGGVKDAVVRPWRAGAEPLQSGGPTLLHLAAGLGYSRLACALLHWRAENPSSVLDAEVDALRQDSAGLTPLAWACAAGHADTARILYRWNAMALRVRDCRNRTATELAAENGHTTIAEELNQFEARRQDERLFLRPASPSPRRPSQDSGLDLALWEEDVRVLTLAEQIIAALPERIKRAGGDSPSSSSSPPAAPLSPLEDALMEQMLQLQLDSNGNARNGQYYPSNCGERKLNGMLGSGAITVTGNGDSEADLSRLTLSDREQRELYHAARMIQKAYRSYKGRQRQEEAERHAAVLIQQYYRRHKQYAYHRQATKAALVIQNNYRNYRSRPGTASARQQAVHQQAAHQAARKIQQFMRQSKIKDYDEDDAVSYEPEVHLGETHFQFEDSRTSMRDAVPP